MEDLQHQNYAAVTGGTALAGTLSSGDAALRLSSSGVWDVPDSTSSSLAVADVSSGGAAISGWFSLPALPAGTATILGKVGSYELKVTSGGRLQWLLTNGANSATVVSNAIIQTSTWYHVAGVYNGDYTGPTIFGNQVQGSLQTGVPPDTRAGVDTGESNLGVGKYTILEKGQISSVALDLQRYYDSTSLEDVAAVVYEDASGAPGRLLGQSEPQRLGADTTRRWVTFPVSCAVFPGSVWLGYLGGSMHGNDITGMQIGYESTGGTAKSRNSPVSDSDFNLTGGAADPFEPAAATNASNISIYANYTATGRTGSEGYALIYLNGVLDNSAAYTHGIADSGNDFQHPTGVAVDLDDWAIWNKKLTAVQVSRHYAAR